MIYSDSVMIIRFNFELDFSLGSPQPIILRLPVIIKHFLATDSRGTYSTTKPI